MVEERRASDERIAKLEVYFETLARDVSDIKSGQQRTDDTVNKILQMVAEARGAANMGKFAAKAATALMGLFGGLIGGGVVTAQSHNVQPVIDQLVK